VQERAEHVAEWVGLTEEKLKKDKPAQVGPVSGKGGRGLEGGINAASREIGVTRQEAQRAVKIASMAPEAKEAAPIINLARTSARSIIAFTPGPARPPPGVTRRTQPGAARGGCVDARLLRRPRGF
jgi:hypothetical protein